MICPADKWVSYYIVKRGDRYWYRTEDEDFNGPFESVERAECELARYMQWLDDLPGTATCGDSPAR